MKNAMIFILIAFYSCILYPMQKERINPMVYLQGKTNIFPVSRDLFPSYTSFGFDRPIITELDDSFMKLFLDLLYLNRMSTCIGRTGYNKCFKDVGAFFEHISVDQSYDFRSWFELIFLVEMANMPSIIKDYLLVHVARLMHDHEREVALAVGEITDQAQQVTVAGILKIVASLYYKLFGEIVEIEGVSKEDYRYTIQQLLIINEDFLDTIIDQDWLNNGKLALNFSHQHIQSVEGFDYCISLLDKKYPDHYYIIDLSHNDIGDLPQNFLVGKEAEVERLNLAHNKIKKLASLFFVNTHIFIINISHNELQELPEGFLCKAKDIEIIDLSYNYIKALPYICLPTEFSGLKKCNLSHNQLLVLPETFLSGYDDESELTLNLSFNELTELPVSLCVEKNFQVLDLSYNKLHMLPENCLSNSTSLEKIMLSNNQLKELPASFLSECENLRVVTLKNRDGSLPENMNELTNHVLKAIEAGNNEMKQAEEKKRKREEEAEEQGEAKRQKK